MEHYQTYRCREDTVRANIAHLRCHPPSPHLSSTTLVQTVYRLCVAIYTNNCKFVIIIIINIIVVVVVVFTHCCDCCSLRSSSRRVIASYVRNHTALPGNSRANVAMAPRMNPRNPCSYTDTVIHTLKLTIEHE